MARHAKPYDGLKEREKIDLLKFRRKLAGNPSRMPEHAKGRSLSAPHSLICELFDGAPSPYCICRQCTP